MTHTITITRENLDQLAKGIAASVNRLGFRKQGKEMVPSQAIRVLAERLGMNEHALVKSLKAQAHAATVALPVTPSRTERSFVLGSLGKDELLDILADKGCYEADMERWTADALRAEILDKEFTADGLCGDCADKEEGEKPMSSSAPATRDLADQAFEHYDFGDDVTVADHEGWESCTGDTVLSKTVFLEELNAPEKPSRKVTFRVNVENGAVTDVSVTS